MSTTKIEITACDNELILIASTPAGSSEIAHIKSGYSNPVSYIFDPRSILAPGVYTLTFIGINWGGPSAFNVNVTIDGVVTTHKQAGSTTNVGVVWNETISIII